MRLTLSADGVAERIGLGLGVVPWPLVQTTFGFGVARSIVVATRLGIFDALAEGGLSAGALAEAIECHPVGTEVLANALVGFDLLAVRDGTYTNARSARRWLVRGVEGNLVDAVVFLGYCHDLAGGLEESVRTGRVERLHERNLEPEFWEAYLKGLASFARIAGKEIAWRARLPSGSKTLLDVGGGHGMYSAALCRKNPAVQATVFDLPPACRVGRTLVAEAGLTDRIGFREGDFRTAALGEGYDAVLIFNVLHNATEGEGRGLVAAAFDALRPGGKLIIWDAAHLGADKLDASAGWNELFFFLISGTRTWPEQTMADWVQGAGFPRPSISRLWVAPTVLLQATRPA